MSSRGNSLGFISFFPPVFIVLISLFLGCAATPTVIIKTQRHPLKAIVFISKEFQDTVFTDRAGNFFPKANIGKSSVKLFKDVFPKLFSDVEFTTENITPNKNQILIIPVISSSGCGNGTIRTCFINYEVSFHGPKDQLIYQTFVRGTAKNNEFIQSLGYSTIVGGPAFAAKILARTFAEAEANAINQLIKNIETSPQLIAYANKTNETFATYKLAPELICKAKFSEPSGNNILDAGEEGKISLEIKNIGEGSVNSAWISINTTKPTAGLVYEKRHFIKSILPGDSIYKEITVKANKSIPDSRVKFKAYILDANNFEFEQIILALETRKLILPISSKRWAVIIGISSYSDSRIPPLSYAAADAKLFYDWVISTNGGKYAPSRVKLLLNHEATGRKIKDALFAWLKQALEEDVVTIYFAGHGSSESPDSPDNLYLFPYDTDYQNIASTGFPMWDIETALKRFIKAKKVIVIADACHSGGIGQDFDIVRRANRGIEVNQISSGFQNLSKIGDGVAALTASDDKQFSQESQKWGGGHGVYTYFLVKGLNGEADNNKDNLVTIGELIPYLSEQVRRETRNAQSPTVGGRFDPALSIGR